MTDQNARPYAAFRLNLEQQQKRAKDLLKSAKAGESATLRRLQGAGFTNQNPLKLADAQHSIAREPLRELGRVETPDRRGGRGARVAWCGRARRRLPHDAHRLRARHRTRRGRARRLP